MILLNIVRFFILLSFGFYVNDGLNHPDNFFNRIKQEGLSIGSAILFGVLPFHFFGEASWQFQLVFTVIVTIMMREALFMLNSPYVPFGKTPFLMVGSAALMFWHWFLDTPSDFYIQTYTFVVIILALVVGIIAFIRRVLRFNAGRDD